MVGYLKDTGAKARVLVQEYGAGWGAPEGGGRTPRG